MSLLDQSVIKKGKEWCVSARAEPGETVQAPGAQTHFLFCLVEFRGPGAQDTGIQIWDPIQSVDS